MKLLLLKIWFIGLPVVAIQQSDTCYCHDKFYVRKDGKVVGSFSILEKLPELKQMKVADQRSNKKSSFPVIIEDLYDIQQKKPCIQKK